MPSTDSWHENSLMREDRGTSPREDQKNYAKNGAGQMCSQCTLLKREPFFRPKHFPHSQIEPQDAACLRHPLPRTPHAESCSVLRQLDTRSNPQHMLWSAHQWQNHLSLKVLNGILTSTKSSPAGTENLFLKHPRLSGSEPPAAQANSALKAPATKVTL